MASLDEIGRLLLLVAWALASVLLVLFVAVVGAFLLWLVFRQWARASDQFNGRNFDGGEATALLLILWTGLVAFFYELYDTLVLLIYDTWELISTRYGAILLLLGLSVGAVVIADLQQDVLYVTGEVYNNYFSAFLYKFYYPLFNGVRLVYDAVVPFFDSAVRIVAFVGGRFLTSAVLCGIEEIGNLILNFVLTVIEFVNAIVRWLPVDPLGSPLDTTPVWAGVGRTLDAFGFVFRCFCRDLERLWKLLIHFFTEDVTHRGLNRLVNAGLQLPQQVGLSIRDRAAPNFDPLFGMACDGLVDVGLGVDGVLNKTYWDLVELIPGFHPIQGDTLPRVACLVTRPACFVLKAANFTTAFVVQVANASLVPGSMDTRQIFREWNDTAACARDVFLFSVDFFDLAAVPPLAKSIVSLGTFTDQAIRFLSPFVYFPLDFLQIIVESAADQENFFGLLQAYYEQGRLEVLFSAPVRAGFALGEIANELYPPLEAIVVCLLNLLSSVLRFLVQFLFFVNRIFSSDAYLQSPAMNRTINVVFDDLRCTAGAFGDISRYLGIVIALLELDDLYAGPPDSPVLAAVDAYVQGVNAQCSADTQTDCDFTAQELANYTDPNTGFVLFDQSCFYIQGMWDAAGDPYWGWLFCAFGNLFADAVDALILVLRSGVLIVQDVIPPNADDIFLAIFYFIQDAIGATAGIFRQASYVAAFLDFEGNAICQDLEPTGCPAPSRPVQGERLADTLYETSLILLTPFDLFVDFVELANGSAAFAPCQGVDITDPSDNSTLAARRVCVQAFATQFVFDPLYQVTNATSQLGTYLNCVLDGLGEPVIDVTCIVQTVFAAFQGVFLDFLMLVLDVVAFFSNASLQNLENIFYDAYQFLLDFLRAIISILWTDIIVPLLRGIIDFIYKLCMDGEAVKRFFGKTPTYNCSEIYEIVGNTTVAPSDSSQVNPRYYEASPTPLPTSDWFASNTPTPTPPSFFFMRRGVDADEGTPDDAARRGSRARKSLRFTEDDDDERGEKRSSDRGQGDPADDAPRFGEGYAETRREDARDAAWMDAPGEEGSPASWVDWARGLWPPTWWTDEAHADRDTVLLPRGAEDAEGRTCDTPRCPAAYLLDLVDVPFSGGFYYRDDEFASAESLWDVEYDFSVPAFPLDSTFTTRWLDHREGDARHRVEARDAGAGSSEEEKEKARETAEAREEQVRLENAREFARRSRFRHRPFFSKKYFRRRFFNDRDFPDGIWRLRGLDGVPYAEVNVRVLAMIEERVDFRGYYDASPLGWQRVLDHAWSLAGHGVELAAGTLRASREVDLWGGLQRFESAARNLRLKGAPRPLFDTVHRAVTRDFGLRTAPFLSSVREGGARASARLGALVVAASDLLLGSSSSSPAHRHALARREETREDRKILRDCAILDEFVEVLLQQVCSLQDYFAPSGMFQAQYASFRNFTLDPLAYTPTVYPEGHGKLNCSYVQAGAEIFGYNNPQLLLPFPNLNLTLARGRNRTDRFCALATTPPLGCRVRRAMLAFDLDVDRWTDDAMETLFGKGRKSGVGFYVTSLLTCNYGKTLHCSNADALGPADALAIVTAVLVALVVVHFFVVRIPILLSLYLLAMFWIYLLLAYGYSPICFPALPYCVADDLFDLTVRTFGICIDWPECLCKVPSPPGANNGTTPCGGCAEYWDAVDDLGIYDGLDNLAILLNRYAPSVVEALRTQKWLRPIYALDFVREPLLKFHFGGRGVPRRYVCNAWLTILNVFPLILVVAVAAFLAQYVALFLRSLLALVAIVLPISVGLVYVFLSQIFLGFGEQFDPNRVVA